MINPVSLSIRAKKLGVLIRDARLAAGKDLPAGAQALGIDEETFERYELGEVSPSLPELEALANFLNVPLDHFWQNQLRSLGGSSDLGATSQRLIALRQRVIGARLRKARQEADLSLEELAEKAWNAPSMIEAYEMGEASIPLPDLEVLANLLNLPLEDFYERHSQPAARVNQPQGVQDFLALSPEMQAFVSKPVNQPYLEVAQRLSKMDADQLRSIAEGLLAITY